VEREQTPTHHGLLGRVIHVRGGWASLLHRGLHTVTIINQAYTLFLHTEEGRGSFQQYSSNP